MSFPLRVGPGLASKVDPEKGGLTAHLNSQIFGIGGSNGPPGSLTDPRNYAGCFADTYCESKRGWKMDLCPSRIGHQGNDIRAHWKEEDKYEAVAFADGVITMITSNTTVVLAADDGTECRYLHMTPASISGLRIGQRVKKGETILGRVGDVMGGKRHGTSLHLHFDCSQTIEFDSGQLRTHVPVYTSLVAAYASAWGIPLSIKDNALQARSPYER
ncbi:hypothetical protein CO669_12375 [Bradyrhizobium sp. Y36]|nr:hypothetical protein CO669_12375 [Bradyrhizobium sp. Y36]